jgi:hypothetical protein
MFKYLLSICLIFLIFSNCKKNHLSEEEPVLRADSDTTAASDPNVFDLPIDSAPRFVNASYIDINKISRISRFRSGIGHDYSDDFEFCRSMKHYFDPGIHSNDTICIYSPVNGRIVRMFSEWAGNQVQIQSDDYPAFTFVLFHVNTLPFVQENQALQAGQLIGYHIGNMTMSDIAVRVNTSGNGPKNDSITQAGGRYCSYFQVINDSVFGLYSQRGIVSRSELIITEDERDQQPLDCNGEYFLDPGTINNWVVLQ